MKFQFGLVTLLVACSGGENVIEKQDNSAPSIMVASHSASVEVLEGYTESFRATVSDDDNDFDELTVAWYVNEEIVCDWNSVSPAGESFCDIAFTTDSTNVVAEVRDPAGAGGRAEVSVLVSPTDAPTATILSPTQNSNHYSDQLIQFAALVGDNEDAPEDLVVSWSSSVDGDLILDTSPDADGNISDYGYLTEGQHALELRVEDSSGKITKEQLVVQVGGANDVPTCGFVSPENQTAFEEGESILFEGTALDSNVDATELLVMFTSDKDGELGEGTLASSGVVVFETDQLSNNTHIISMSVTDEVGAQCQDTRVISIGTPPTANIVEPLSGDVFSLGTDVLFTGSFTDAEDSMSDVAVSWVSSSGGEIASGIPDSQGIHQFSSNSLGAGLHTISLNASDTTGLTGSDTVTIRVNTPPTAPMVTLGPDPIYGDGTLTAAATGSTDADGNSITYVYQWFENGVLHSSTLNSIGSSDLDVGDMWTVRVTPNDGYTDGPYTEVNITVSNSDPTLTTPLISSSNGSMYNDSVLTCISTASDSDEVVTATYSWNVGGAMVAGSTVDLSNYSVSVGDSIECIASVSDSNGGSATSSGSTLIENRSPNISSVSISPSSPNSQEVLTCSVMSSDLDGESLTESMEWFVAGSSVSTGMTLDLSSVGVNPTDTVECVVVVTDPSGDSDQQSSSVTVLNTNPTIDVLTLNPAEPTLNDTLSCYAESSDVDGDTPTLSFSFTNQNTGSVFTPTTTSTNVATLDVSSTDADYDHVLTCSVISTDADNGTVTDSINTTIVNTAPVFDQGAVITPSTVEIGTNVECSAVASDPDDGVASLSYIWQVNGSQVAVGSTWIVNSVDASVGDSLTCTAIAVDFEGNSTTSTSVGSTISNTAPVVSGVVLNNLGPYTNDVLTVSPTTFDFNGDSVTLNYEWHVMDASNGGVDTIIQLGAGSAFSSLDGSQMMGFDRDDEVYVMVTPNDGVDNGTTVESDHAVVLNTAPSAPTITVTSAVNPPIEMVDDLTCTVVNPSTDIDGDSFTYTYTWYDPTGTDVQIVPQTSALSDVFSGANTTDGLWECDVSVSDGTDTNNGSNSIQVEADWAGPLEFTNCGQTGHTGPSQSQCDGAYAGSELEGGVTVLSGIQVWTVPVTGTYVIEAVGAAGNNGNSTAVGYGAQMSGEFVLAEGTELQILVGQFPQSNGGDGAGGGGSFVTQSPHTSQSDILIIAGGGGGGTVGYGYTSSSNASTSTTAGTSSTGCSGGSSGNGGDVCGYSGSRSCAGQGGGFLTNGGVTDCGSIGSNEVARSYVNGGEGGVGSCGLTPYGGFGGGGGTGCGGAGGGGGYSGGGGSYAGGTYGGGGASYNTGSSQTNQSGANSGHGYVTIDKL